MADNVKPARILDESTEHSDGLENLMANLGTELDKRSHSTFVNNKNLSANGHQIELEAMYRTDWLCGKVVDIIPDDMCREWREFTGDIDPEIVKKLVAEESRLGLNKSFNLAHKWGRLYGTAYIVIAADDGQEPDKPLDISKLTKGSLKHIKVVDRHRLVHAGATPVVNPLDSNFGMPEHYRFNETSILIHHTRVLRFEGNEIPYDEFRRNNYNSDSVLSRLYDTVTNFNTAANGTASMIYETNVDIVKIKNLMGHLQTPEGEALLRKRFTLANAMKSINNMFLLDEQETFETKTNTFSGLPDLLRTFATFLSAGSDIPATRLLGTSASGINATGEGDLKNYYDTIRSNQSQTYRPLLDRFDELMAINIGLPDDVELEYEFKSLFQMTPSEIADINLKDAQRDDIYMTNNIIAEDIVLKELEQKGTYSNITPEHIAEMEAFENGFISNPKTSEPGAE